MPDQDKKWRWVVCFGWGVIVLSVIYIGIYIYSHFTTSTETQSVQSNYLKIFFAPIIAFQWIAFVLAKHWYIPSEIQKNVLSKILHLLLDVLVAATFAAFIAFSTNLVTTPEAKDIAVALALAIVILSIQLISNAVGITEKTSQNIEAVTEAKNELIEAKDKLIEDFQNETSKIRESAETLNKYKDIISSVAYSDIAARALEVKQQTLSVDDKVRPFLATAIQASVHNTKQWLSLGSKLQNNHNLLHSRTWWGLMETYYREERYDIARYEIVTNVRNYAFIILRLIWDFLSSEVSGKKIIVGQVTPFPPKDFYNYPNGSSDNRFYHDAEFFGTYRRGLSFLTKHPDIKIRRIVLGTNEKPNRDLGWNLDHILKIIIGCRYMHVIPTSVPIDIRNQNNHSISHHEDVEKLLVSAIHAKTDEDDKHKLPPDPASRLRRIKEPYYSWVPVYSDNRWQNPDTWLYGLTKNYNILDKTRKNFYNQRWDQVTVTNDEKILSNGNHMGLSISKIIERTKIKESDYWTRLMQICEKYIPSSGEGNEDQRKLDKSKKRLESLKQEVTENIQALNAQNSFPWWKQEHQLTNAIIENVIEIFKSVQIIDEQLVALDSSLISTSSLGLPMGKSEKWLYWWLAILESELSVPLIGDSQHCEESIGLPTIWQRFCEDILGTAACTPVSDREFILNKDSQMQAEVFNRFRLAVLSQDSKSVHSCKSIRYVEENDLKSEFLIIGIEDSTGKVDWQ
ncbi:hypothetical protein [Nitrosomonas marina]|uniref:Uncharacterized protein n=1 Tax=Nitrosomonas marina TaxID=917 RepID=A0A1H8G300_9PROT|nr:hypothetical protein [Nitrosomonas marina]SEN38393.1 hypothetical protein SAMN05216325_1169 [Nitrosomonas marina]